MEKVIKVASIPGIPTDNKMLAMPSKLNTRITPSRLWLISPMYLPDCKTIDWTRGINLMTKITKVAMIGILKFTKSKRIPKSPVKSDKTIAI